MSNYPRLNINIELSGVIDGKLKYRYYKNTDKKSNFTDILFVGKEFNYILSDSLINRTNYNKKLRNKEIQNIFLSSSALNTFRREAKNNL